MMGGFYRSFNRKDTKRSAVVGFGSKEWKRGSSFFKVEFANKNKKERENPHEPKYHTMSYI